jgi:hypothetical protein
VPLLAFDYLVKTAGTQRPRFLELNSPPEYRDGEQPAQTIEFVRPHRVPHEQEIGTQPRHTHRFLRIRAKRVVNVGVIDRFRGASIS